MIRRLTILAIALATIALVSTFLLSNALNGVFASLAIGMAWVVLELMNRPWAASLGLTLLVLLAVIGASSEYFAVFDALAVVAALSAWDLSRFGQRLIMIEDASSWTTATRRHVRRLLLVNGAGLMLAIAAIGIQLGGGFFLAWILAIGVIVALYVLVIRMTKLTQ